MKGYVARKGNRWYAVIYEGLDPVTGRERRSWHPAGTDRADAERQAWQLAAKVNGRDGGRALSFGAYLTTRWLPGKRLALRATTWDGYRRKIDRHILPMLGRIPIRRLRPAHLEALYQSMVHPTDGRRELSPKTVLEVHLIIRSALGDAELWSATSYKALREDALAAVRWNRLHPNEAPRTPYVTEALSQAEGPVVAISDFMQAVPDQVAKWVPGQLTTLGPDGYGRSDTRAALRRHFETDAPHLVVAVLAALAETGEGKPEEVADAIARYKLDVEAMEPWRA